MSAEQIVLALGLWSVKCSVVLLIACIAAWLCRRLNAATRHLIWLGGLATCALMPGAAFITPPIKSAVVQSVAETVREGVRQPLIRVRPNLVAVHSNLHRSVDPSPEFRPPRAGPNLPKILDEKPATSKLHALSASSIKPSLATKSGPTLNIPDVNWAFAVLSLWVLGASLRLSQLLRSLVRGRRLVSQAHTVANLSGILDGKLPADVRASQGVQAPVAFGWLRPTVILPNGYAEWPDETLRSALVHEFSHVRRRDWPVLICAQILLALQWFNPLVWVAVSRLRSEAEFACDDEVIIRGFAATRYASDLFEIAKRVSMDNDPLAVSMARRPAVEGRIASILSGATGRRLLGARLLIGIVPPVVFAVALFAACRPLVERSLTSGSGPMADSDLQTVPSDLQFPTNGGFGAELPGGVSVELVRVSGSPATFGTNSLLGETWYPDGRPALTALEVRPDAVRELEPTDKPLHLAFRVQADQTREISLFGFAQGAAPKLSDTNLLHRQNYASYTRSVFASGTSATIEKAVGFSHQNFNANSFDLAIAIGEWAEVKLFANELKPRAGSPVTISLGVHEVGNAALKTVGQISADHGSTQVIDLNMDLTEADWKVVPLDRDGALLPSQLVAGVQPKIVVPGSAAGKIASFAVYKRPWTWIQFAGIAMSPQEGDYSLQTPSAARIVAQGNAANLGDGLTVRLRAVSKQFNPQTANDVWLPDGRPWTSSFELPRSTWRSSWRALGYESNARSLTFEFDSSTPRDVSVTGFVPGVALAHSKSTDLSWDEYQASARIPKGKSNASTDQVWFGEAKTGRYDLGVAKGPWQAVRTVPNTLVPTNGQWLQINLGAQVSTDLVAPPNSGTTSTNPSNELLSGSLDPTKDAIRVIPLDKSGRPVPISDDSGVLPLQGIETLSARDSTRVAAFRIERRPWTWVEFDHLTLDPRQDSRIVYGDAIGISPNAQTTFADGTKFSVPAICVMPPRQGFFQTTGLWRGDGELLAKDPSLYLPYTSVGSMKDPMAVMSRITSPPAPSPSAPSTSAIREIYAIRRVVPDGEETRAFRSTKGWMYDVLGAGTGITSSMLIEREDFAAEATCIAGLASGPWRTFAKIPFQFSALAPQAGLHIECSMNSSSLSFKTQRGTVEWNSIHKIDPLKNAIHFIAVDAKGRRYLCRQSGSYSGSMYNDFRQLDAIGTDQNGAGQGIRLREVDHFEVETCPYTFKYLRHLALIPNYVRSQARIARSTR